MAIRSRDIGKLINECDFYEDEIYQPSYIPGWTMLPKATYASKTPNRKCWTLESIRLNSPNSRIINSGPGIDNIFAYKNNFSRRNGGVNVKEFFGSPRNNTGIILLILLIGIIFFHNI